MKQIICIATLVFMAASQFTACKKSPVEVPVEEPGCRIASIKTKNAGQFNFTYNELGNPVSAIPESTTTGNPEAHFIYDKLNRISDYMGAYTRTLDADQKPYTGFLENWVRFTYTDNNPAALPVGDTIRYLSLFINGVLNRASLTQIRLYRYDQKGRIVQLFVREGLYGKDTINYSYDERGNLNRPNITYDNKRNYRSGNKVLMLVDQNYSVNNPFTATTYNEKGLPLTVPSKQITVPYHDNFLLRQMDFESFQYNCDNTGSRRIK
jgi:hypothetical protein